MEKWFESFDKGVEGVWPSWQEVYSRFGLAAHEASKLESTLISILGLAEGYEKRPMQIEDVYVLLAQMGKKTLGQLIASLRARFPLPADFETVLSEALEKRNYLIHAFFKKRIACFGSPQGCTEMIVELTDIRDSLEAADQYMNRLLRSCLRVLGISLDEMERLE